MSGPILFAVPFLFVWGVVLVVVAHRAWNLHKAGKRLLRGVAKLEDALATTGGGE